MQVTLIGGGIIGLSVGWQLERAGIATTLFEAKKVGQGASFVAAGMLAPFIETPFAHQKLLEMGQESLRSYPFFLKQLQEDSSTHIPLQKSGTLFVQTRREEQNLVPHLYQRKKEQGVQAFLLTKEETQKKLPFLSPKVHSSTWLPEDAHIDQRALLKALKKAYLKRGGNLIEEEPVEKIITTQGKIEGLVTKNTTHHCNTLIITAGASSAKFGAPIRPVHGTILTLKTSLAFKPVLRTPHVYIVPKKEGIVRVGATSEELGFEKRIPIKGIRELLREAFEVLPAIDEMSLVAVDSGLRPVAAQELPIMGKTQTQGLFMATGHGRGGILLAPLTAYRMQKLIVEAKR